MDRFVFDPLKRGRGRGATSTRTYNVGLLTNPASLISANPPFLKQSRTKMGMENLTMQKMNMKKKMQSKKNAAKKMEMTKLKAAASSIADGG